MSLHVLDTDTLSLYHYGNAALMAKLDAHPPDELGITIITVEEELAGWYTLLRKARLPDEQVRAYERLAEAIPLLSRWQILPMTSSAIARYEVLKRMNLNIRKMDLRIASIVLEHSAVLVSRNLRDFQRIPNLQVEDWVS
ncbi:MAG: type II toxin-antitoxin system VapC family toxin [Isosphaeraceae bacterium]